MLIEVIKEGRLDIFFQPIISIKNKKVFAFEALLRAYDGNGEILSPAWLFQQAKKENLSFVLDEAARILAIEKFKPYFDANPKLLLFLNFESSSIDRNSDIQQYRFKDKLNELDIPFKNIVLEVKEDEIHNTDALESFCKYYKSLGFSIALDDFGTGNSSFDRLSIIMPTIVKVDRSIIYNIQSNYINTEILKAISNMCKKIGALVLAEGVETHEEVLECMHGGIDIYQGYWFAWPQKNFTASVSIPKKIVDLVEDFIQERRNRAEVKKDLFEQANRLANRLLEVCVSGEKDNRSQLASLVQREPNIESVYVIDAQTSRQIGETIINVTPKCFYEPSIEGEDHSLKEYVYMTKVSINSSHMTARYISGASGNMCYTFSKKLILNGRELIFCVDIYEEAQRIKNCA